MSTKPNLDKAEEASLSSEAAPMSTTRRVVIVGVAIFCLIVFSATGPMFAVFSGIFGEGPGEMATLDLPSGSASISSEDYQAAYRLMSMEKFVMGVPRSDDDEGVIAYAALSKLADELEFEVTDDQVRDFIRFQMAISRIADYKDLYQRFRFNSAAQYENLLRQLLRVQGVETLLSTAAIPTRLEVLDYWAEDHKELQLEFVSWKSEDFSKAADALDPDEETLNNFFADGLGFSQKRELENEEAVAFEALLISADALQTAVVQAWATQEEPTEDQLQGFYDFRRFTLYRRPEPAEGETVDPELGLVLTREELGDKLKQDFVLHLAAKALIAEANDEDLAGYAANKGVEYLAEATPVGATALDSLPRIGTLELREMFRAEVGEWMDKAFLVGDIAFVLRPTVTTPRAMPELAEVKDSVIDYWRETQRSVLAEAAADAFVAGLPQPEIEGDSIIMAGDSFGKAGASAGHAIQTLDWVSRRIRPAVDPIWGEDKVRPWLRSTVGVALEDYSAGEIIGPLENVAGESFVVVRLVATRPADAEKMWPSEVDAAKARARQESMTQFRADQLSYEGLARSYNIVKKGNSDS